MNLGLLTSGNGFTKVLRLAQCQHGIARVHRHFINRLSRFSVSLMHRCIVVTAQNTVTAAQEALKQADLTVNLRVDSAA
eukprot:CAMPEP_0173131226 /NCGR_PEP_ID=MMETSP1102-20130122/60511_1 /TAXON_ID=49646 /ORGANISM="Geminigera sp., Strain Caron Lab Isolate" /LENGTH=78 /DNA_ID=CAMNT_0014042495 /DNA_START=59 /DNA_END=295 /DNA_ORIENTATION=-